MVIPTDSHDAVELIGYIQGFAILIMAPLDAGLAAIKTLLVMWLTRQRNSPLSLVGAAILIGAGTGLMLAVGAGQLIIKLLCKTTIMCSQ